MASSLMPNVPLYEEKTSETGCCARGRFGRKWAAGLVYSFNSGSPADESACSMCWVSMRQWRSNEGTQG